MPTPGLRRASTLAKIRFLREVTPKDVRRRGGRMPPQQQPDLIRLGYHKALWADVRPALDPLVRVGVPIIRMVADERAEEDHAAATDRLVKQARGDASGRKAKAEQLAAKALERADELLDIPGVAHSARAAAQQTNVFNREQFGRQVTQALGVPYFSVEKSTRDLVPPFIVENVKLVKTLPERYHDRLAKLVEEAFTTGMRPETLAGRIAELDEFSESDTMRIARDQVGKINGEFNMVRQTDLGVERYIWRTMNDNRVRDEHVDRDGKTYSWSDPPEDGHPGEPIQCRCYAEPDFSDIIASL